MSVLLRQLFAGFALAAATQAVHAQAAELAPCRLKGIEREVRCGTVTVPEDPDRPDGRTLQIRFAVVPALAKRKDADPLFIFAGGPGQAATRVAGLMQPALERVNARRDLVYVDQRGTGDSHPLECERPPEGSLADTLDPARAVKALGECLKRLPADTRQYATWIAVRDVEAVRARLGAARINLWGGSYGTRAAMEYLRQYPQHVRAVVLDGAAPAAMALPASLPVDSDLALQRVLDTCAADARCRGAYPKLPADLARLQAAAARAVQIEVAHPVTGVIETIRLDTTALASLLRAPLYSPTLAAVLPQALARAAVDEDYAPLFALSSMLSTRLADNFSEGMHFAVVCAEDMPRISAAERAAAAKTRFGVAFIDLYARACAQVPVRAVPAAFYAPPPKEAVRDVPVLILSGGADPVTPPRHGETLAAALPRARHLVAPNLGHGITHQACAPELIARFLRTAVLDDLDGSCLARLPAPAPLVPLHPRSEAK